MTKARGSFQNRLTQLVCKVMAKQSGTQCMSWYSIMPILQAIGRWTSKRSDTKKKKQEHKYCPSLTASEEFGKTVLWSCLDAVVWVMMVTLVGLGPKMSCT